MKFPHNVVAGRQTVPVDVLVVAAAAAAAVTAANAVGSFKTAGGGRWRGRRGVPPLLNSSEAGSRRLSPSQSSAGYVARKSLLFCYRYPTSVRTCVDFGYSEEHLFLERCSLGFPFTPCQGFVDLRCPQ